MKSLSGPGNGEESCYIAVGRGLDETIKKGTARLETTSDVYADDAACHSQLLWQLLLLVLLTLLLAMIIYCDSY